MGGKNNKKGFTLLEVLTVVIIIGILAALGFAGMNELIQTNKAKETARTITSFAERALAEGKMRKDSVSIRINNNTIEARLLSKDSLFISQTLANGFSAGNTTDRPTECESVFSNNAVTSQVRIGISGIDGEGCFVVCNPANYCGSAVKTKDRNTFTAHIKKRNSGGWEAL